jgi:hypothetical protein
LRVGSTARLSRRPSENECEPAPAGAPSQHRPHPLSLFVGVAH